MEWLLYIYFGTVFINVFMLSCGIYLDIKYGSDFKVDDLMHFIGIVLLSLIPVFQYFMSYAILKGISDSGVFDNISKKVIIKGKG